MSVSLVPFIVDQMIGCFCHCSAQKQTEPLPIEKVHAMCEENRALYSAKLWNFNIMVRFLSLIFRQFVPGIYVVLDILFKVLKTKIYWRKVDFFDRKRFGLFLCRALTETADQLV